MSTLKVLCLWFSFLFALLEGMMCRHLKVEVQNMSGMKVVHTLAGYDQHDDHHDQDHNDDGNDSCCADKEQAIAMRLTVLINRPGVGGTFLHTASLMIKSLIYGLPPAFLKFSND